jgi:hypothetical protein
LQQFLNGQAAAQYAAFGRLIQNGAGVMPGENGMNPQQVAMLN